jgi:hypothetical protein
LVIIVPAQKTPFSQSLVVGPSKTRQRAAPPAASNKGTLSSMTCILVEKNQLLAQNFKHNMQKACHNITVVIQDADELRDYLSRDEPQKIHCVAANDKFWSSLTAAQVERLTGVVMILTGDVLTHDNRYHTLTLPITQNPVQHFSAIIKAIKRNINREANDLFIYDRFEQGKLLGSGGAANVFLGESKLSGARVAIKLYNTRGLPTMKREEQTYRKLESRSKGCPEHQGAQYILHPISIKEESLVLELCEVALSDDKLKLDERSLLRCFLEIIEGVAFLHAQHIAHRDLKPQNVMLRVTPVGKIAVAPFLNQSAEVRIIDLGSAAFSSDSFPLTSRGQTQLYAEQCQSFEDCCRADIWAIGLTAMEQHKLLPSRPEMSPAKLLTIVEGSAALPDVWKRLLPQMICEPTKRKLAHQLAELFKAELVNAEAL